MLRHKASSATDPRDADGNGIINLTDLFICIRKTRKYCAVIACKIRVRERRRGALANRPVSCRRGAFLAAFDRADACLGLRPPPLVDGRREACEVEARRCQTGIARAVLDEAIRYADMQKGQLHAVGRE